MESILLYTLDIYSSILLYITHFRRSVAKIVTLHLYFWLVWWKFRSLEMIFPVVPPRG